MVRFNITLGAWWSGEKASGTAKVLEKGFQMQLGCEGYKLEVIESENYAAGTVIYAYSYNVMGA